MHPRNYLRNTVQILIALVFASLASQSLTGASKSKIGAFGSGYWVLDQNGNNTWDGPPIDGVPLWSTGDSREIAVYGDWNGDGRTKMGVYLDGVWILDYNGNGVWDGPDVDKVFTFGNSDFVPIVGDWNHTGWTKIGIHGISNSAAGQFLGQFLLDYNGNFRWDDTTVDRAVYWSLGITTGEIAVIGDWNGDGNDKIGIYSGGYWVLDYNGNNAWDGLSVDRDVYWSIDSHDIPVVGNWNGQLNSTKIGVYSDGHWMADYNGNFILDGQTRFSFFGGGNSTFLPAVGDWNDDGKTKIAAYLITSGTWWIEKSGNWLWDGPSGGDVYTSFGGPTYVKPIVGNWERPPTVQFSVSGYTGIGMNFQVGDTFFVTITGSPNQPVTVGLDGGTPVLRGYTNSEGNFSTGGIWGSSDTGGHNQTWYVNGAAGGPILSYLILPNPGNSVANSFNAPPNPLPHNDINGSWQDTIPGYSVATWTLTQNGTAVNGTMTRTAFSQCGITSYGVSGNLSNGVFSLTATFQNNQYSCDAGFFLVAVSIQEDITISGPSASQATAQWNSINTQGDPGAGNSSWLAKTQHYNVSYASYIPVDHILGPSPCPGQVVRLFYKGDSFRQTYRTTQSILAIPGANYSYGFFANTGPTRNYGTGSPQNGLTLDSVPLTNDIYNGPYQGADEDGFGNDCFKWNAAAQASTADMQEHASFFPSTTQANVQLVGIGRDPLEPQLQQVGIRWSMVTSIEESNPASPTATVTYNHTCYPAHIVKVNGTVVYSYQPPYNNTAYLEPVPK